MRFRNTAILAVIVVLVGAWLYFVERPAVERESEKKTLIDFDPEDAAGIVLEYPDRTIELAERDGRWVITRPRELEADQTTVQSLLRATAEAELKRVVDEKPADLAKFGLSPPAATIRIRLDDGKELPAVAVGESTPIGFNAYARRGDEPAVLLTSGSFQSGVKKDLEDLRDKTVVRFEDADVQRITLRPASGPQTVVERAGEDGWRIVEPVEAKADRTAVQGLLASLRAMRARGFADSPDAGDDGERAAEGGEKEGAPEEGASAPAEHGFAPPRLTVEIATDKGDPQVVELGAEKSGEGEKLVYVRVPGRPTVYEVGAHSYTSLAKSPNDLRDKTVLEVDAGAVTRLELVRADGEGFELERRDDAWTVAGAEGATTRESVASRLVEDATALKGSEVVSEPAEPAAVGLDEPAIRIVLEGEKGDVLGEILLASDGERHYAMRAGGPVVYGIADYVYRRFDKHKSDLVEVPVPTATEAAPTDAEAPAPDAEAPATDAGPAAPTAAPTAGSR